LIEPGNTTACDHRQTGRFSSTVSWLPQGTLGNGTISWAAKNSVHLRGEALKVRLSTIYTNRAAAYIVVAFFALIAIYVRIGGVFNRQFWLSFLPGVMENLVILAIAVLVIDSISKRQNRAKLQQANARPSRTILSISNKLAYLLLEYLALATREELHSDKAPSFQFAIERLRRTDLGAAFHERLMNAQDKAAFAEGFENILIEQTEGVANSLKEIYPRPDPIFVQGVEQMQFGIGSVMVLKDVLGAFKTVNAQAGSQDQLHPEQLDLITEIGYRQVGLQLNNMRDFIINLSDRAKANRLFISLH